MYTYTYICIHIHTYIYIYIYIHTYTGEGAAAAERPALVPDRRQLSPAASRSQPAERALRPTGTYLVFLLPAVLGNMLFEYYTLLKCVCFPERLGSRKAGARNSIIIVIISIIVIVIIICLIVIVFIIVIISIIIIMINIIIIMTIIVIIIHRIGGERKALSPAPAARCT